MLDLYQVPERQKTKGWSLLVILFNNVKKSKSVPLQAQGAQRVPRKLRYPDYVTVAQDGGKVVSLMHRPILPPGNNPGTRLC